MVKNIFLPFLQIHAWTDKENITFKPVKFQQTDSSAMVSSSSVSFHCNKSGCDFASDQYDTLVAHLDAEDHSQNLNVITPMDKAKVMFVGKINEGISDYPTLQPDHAQAQGDDSSFPTGWALKKQIRHNRFDE